MKYIYYIFVSLLSMISCGSAFCEPDIAHITKCLKPDGIVLLSESAAQLINQEPQDSCETLLKRSEELIGRNALYKGKSGEVTSYSLGFLAGSYMHHPLAYPTITPKVDAIGEYGFLRTLDDEQKRTLCVKGELAFEQLTAVQKELLPKFEGFENVNVKDADTLRISLNEPFVAFYENGVLLEESPVRESNYRDTIIISKELALSLEGKSTLANGDYSASEFVRLLGIEKTVVVSDLIKNERVCLSEGSARKLDIFHAFLSSLLLKVERVGDVTYIGPDKKIRDRIASNYATSMFNLKAWNTVALVIEQFAKCPAVNTKSGEGFEDSIFKIKLIPIDKASTALRQTASWKLNEKRLDGKDLKNIEVATMPSPGFDLYRGKKFLGGGSSGLFLHYEFFRKVSAGEAKAP